MKWARRLPLLEIIGVLVFLSIFAHCGYVYATCNGKVVKGYFDQPVCLERP